MDYVQHNLIQRKKSFAGVYMSVNMYVGQVCFHTKSIRDLN